MIASLDAAASLPTISRECTRLAIPYCGPGLRAIVLTGSLARNEASVISRGDACRFLSDAEFILVFSERSKARRPSTLAPLRRQIEQALSELGVAVHITMGGMDPADLRTLPRHIFTYELRRWGQVVWGDSDVLSAIPKFPASAISREDAWRMLCNRMVELLEASVRLRPGMDSLPAELFPPTAKLYLDMATSFLVFRKAYQPSYRRRAAAIRALAARHSSSPCPPFGSLQRFSDRVSECTDLKLRAALPMLPLRFWQESLADARCLWEWELKQLNGGWVPLPAADLVGRWAKSQRLPDRVRGWAYVIRKCGWHRSFRFWPRWALCSLNSSPRYRVYAAAAELFFRLPELVESGDSRLDESTWHRVVSRLPATGPLLASSARTWSVVAAEVARNYHDFVEGTTA